MAHSKMNSEKSSKNGNEKRAYSISSTRGWDFKLFVKLVTIKKGQGRAKKDTFSFFTAGESEISSTLWLERWDYHSMSNVRYKSKNSHFHFLWWGFLHWQWFYGLIISQVIRVLRMMSKNRNLTKRSWYSSTCGFAFFVMRARLGSGFIFFPRTVVMDFMLVDILNEIGDKVKGRSLQKG